jgi:hypothetical protein
MFHIQVWENLGHFTVLARSTAFSLRRTEVMKKSKQYKVAVDVEARKATAMATDTQGVL